LWWILLLTIIVASWALSEVRAQIALSKLNLTTTRDEVIGRLGAPDRKIRWEAWTAEGDVLVYRYSYFWDYLLPFKETRTITVHFRDGEEQLIAVESHHAYSDSTYILIDRNMRR
jgi:hypothetical protein